MASLIDILGWLGGTEVLIAYILVSFKIVHPENFYYQLLNLMGAFLLIINTWYHEAYPSSIVNSIWVGIAIYTIIKFKKVKV
jgi:hypothetical protein